VSVSRGCDTGGVGGGFSGGPFRGFPPLRGTGRCWNATVPAAHHRTLCRRSVGVGRRSTGGVDGRSTRCGSGVCRAEQARADHAADPPANTVRRFIDDLPDSPAPSSGRPNPAAGTVAGPALHCQRAVKPLPQHPPERNRRCGAQLRRRRKPTRTPQAPLTPAQPMADHRNGGVATTSEHLRRGFNSRVDAEPTG